MSSVPEQDQKWSWVWPQAFKHSSVRKKNSTHVSTIERSFIEDPVTIEKHASILNIVVS